MIRFVILAGALLLVLPAQAQMYKWVDANGRVQYSDKPPAGKKAETVSGGRVGTVSSGQAASGDAAKPTGPKTIAEQEADYRKRQMEAAEAKTKEDKLAQEKRLTDENCRRARSQLASLESGVRQRRVNDKGEAYYPDEAQLNSETELARREVATNCK